MVLLTMSACMFVSVIIPAEMCVSASVCVCVCCLCGNLASVYSRLLCGQTADLGQERAVPTGTGLRLVWCGQTQSGTTLKFLLGHNVFVLWSEKEGNEWVRERRGGGGGGRCDETLSLLQSLSLLSPPQQLSHHLPVPHYATFPCSFLSDIKGWCEFYWTQNHVWTFSPTWPCVKKKEKSARQNVKMYTEAERWCVTPKCFTTNTLKAISLLAAGLFGPTHCFFTMYRCWGEEKGCGAERWGGGPVVPQTRSACSPWWRNGNCQLWA